MEVPFENFQKLTRGRSQKIIILGSLIRIYTAKGAMEILKAIQRILDFCLQAMRTC